LAFITRHLQVSIYYISSNKRCNSRAVNIQTQKAKHKYEQFVMSYENNLSSY